MNHGRCVLCRQTKNLPRLRGRVCQWCWMQATHAYVRVPPEAAPGLAAVRAPLVNAYEMQVKCLKEIRYWGDAAIAYAEGRA
jgi:hypothetical protein